MKVGDVIQCDIVKASLSSMGGRVTCKKRGTVVYIHPQNRFYRVRFDFPYGSWHESFIMEGGTT